jgi:pantoate--beta-alanine ligase
LAGIRSVRTVQTVAAVREAVAVWRAAGDSIAFVPTMGNLHTGHISLTTLAAERAVRVVMSIFVNPTQFGAGEDFATYPRTLADDARLVTRADTVDLLFVPEAAEIYPFGIEQAIRLQLPPLSLELCGASRPGHFDGVASVVCRLLNVVAPDLLVLGQKDYQQFILMRLMVEDLRLPVRLQMGPIYREPDGLAMSSRNRYLDTQQRYQAPALHAALGRVRNALRGGAVDFEALTATAKAELRDAVFRPDYVEIRRRSDLGMPHAEEPDRPWIVLGAAWLGRARLIDNLIV